MWISDGDTIVIVARNQPKFTDIDLSNCVLLQIASTVCLHQLTLTISIQSVWNSVNRNQRRLGSMKLICVSARPWPSKFGWGSSSQREFPRAIRVVESATIKKGKNETYSWKRCQRVRRGEARSHGRFSRQTNNNELDRLLYIWFIEWIFGQVDLIAMAQSFDWGLVMWLLGHCGRRRKASKWMKGVC